MVNAKDLSNEQIRKNRDEIISLLRSTNRDGIENVISFMDKSGYFYLYGSFKHHTYKGGLAEHSLGVCNMALKNNEGCDRNSIIISSLLHDLCKVKYDYPDKEFYKGHGTLSLRILKNLIGFDITDEEAHAIRFHMADRSGHYEQDEEWEIAKTEKLRNLIHSCDCFDAGRYDESMYQLFKLFVK